MTDRNEAARSKAASDFNRKGLKEIMDKLKPALLEAGKLLHKIKAAEVPDDLPDDDDGCYESFGRTVELGLAVDNLTGLCGPHIALVNEILDVLTETEDQGEDETEVVSIPHPQH